MCSQMGGTREEGTVGNGCVLSLARKALPGWSYVVAPRAGSPQEILVFIVGWCTGLPRR